MDERPSTEAFDAATANQHFLAIIIARLVARGALTALDVSDAIESERRIIETLRREGLDPRLLASASDALAELLADSFRGHGLSSLPWSRWSFDPADPCWPAFPDNDP